MLTFPYIMGLWQMLTQAMNEKKYVQQKFTKISQRRSQIYKSTLETAPKSTQMADLKSTLLPTLF